MGESPIPYVGSVPNRVVRVVLPASVANDLGKMQRALANLAEQFGCPDCLSGVDCAFEVERAFVIDAKTLRARGRSGAELSRDSSVRVFDKPYGMRAMDKSSPVRALDQAGLASSARDIAKAARDVAAAARDLIRAGSPSVGSSVDKATAASVDKAAAASVDKAAAASVGKMEATTRPSPDAVKSIADVVKSD